MYFHHACTSKLLHNLATDPAISPFLLRLRNYHEETYAHSLRVCQLSLDLAIQQHLSPSDLSYLGCAGLLHDIGKLEIPRTILDKPTALTASENQIMQKHVRLSFWAIESIEAQRPDYEIVKKIAVAHHEFTTTPYPRNNTVCHLKAPKRSDRRRMDRNLYHLSQILAIADMTDALHHTRSYKRSLSRSEVECILRQEFQGDSYLVDDALWRLVEETQPLANYH